MGVGEFASLSSLGGEEHKTGRECHGERGGGGPRVPEEPGRPEGERGQQPENRKRDEDDAEQEHQTLLSEATGSGGSSASASETGVGRRSDTPTATASSTTITARETNAGTL